MINDEEKLQKLLDYVSNNNEFYKKHGISNGLLWENAPMIDRSTVQKAKKRILSQDYLGLNMQKIITLITSGSSGEPLRVYWDPVDYYKSMFCLWKRRYSYYGILPTSSVVNFNYNVYSNDRSRNGLIYYRYKNVLSINKASLNNDNALHELTLILGKTKIDWMYIQPSTLNKVLNYYVDSRIPFPKVKYIESVGEVLPEKLKLDLLNYTGISIKNMYGSEEMNGIAIECPYGNMHVISENVIVECLNGNCISQSGNGISIITNLHNRAMPFIRYNQGDEIELTDRNQCKCGFCDPIITRIVGRQRVSIDVNGKTIDSSIISEIIETVNNLLEYPIYSYHFDYISAENKLIGFLKIEAAYSDWIETITREIYACFETRGYSIHNIIIKYNEDSSDYYKTPKILRLR